MMNYVFLLLKLTFLINGVPLDKVVKELNQLSSKSLLLKENKPNKSNPLTITLEDSELVQNWPSPRLMKYLGEVSGLAFCPKGFLFIFQRADIEMNERSFNEKNQYMKIDDGPIKENTIIKLNNRVDDPKVVAEFGSNLFYLPHGIFVNKDYMITTDLARHQIFRIPHNSNEPDLILGEKFVPGNDSNHFCKPTHAVIANDGSIFVADGYCNSRVVKFDKDGQFQTQFGDKKGKEELSLPHHLALIESKDLICVADRENMRVQCYCAGLKEGSKSGKLIRSITHERFGPIYALGYNNQNNMLYIVSGMINENDRSRVFIYNWSIDMVTGTLEYSSPNGFGMAHSISVCPKGQCVAIGGLTKECMEDSLSCIENNSFNDNYQLRNIWLYRLLDENFELE